MRIELKNVKRSEFASHGTVCFEASLYVDGKRVGGVSNDGQGGCNVYRLLSGGYQAVKALEERARAHTGEEFEPLDQMVAEALDAWEMAKQLRKWRKGKTVFRLEGDPVAALKARYKDKIAEIYPPL